MRWFLKTFWKAIGLAFLLLGIFWLPSDLLSGWEALKPWQRMLSRVDKVTALWVFSVATLVYIFWIDFGPRFNAWLSKRRAARHDPPDIAMAKEQLRAFVCNHLEVATAKVHGAVRLSAYAFKDAWPDPPAGQLGWAGILNSGIKTSEELKLLQAPEFIRTSGLEQLQNMTERAIISYRVSVHKLLEVVAGLQSHSKLRDTGGFYSAVKDWYPQHDELVKQFLSSQRQPSLKIIRGLDIKIYFCDPRYDLSPLRAISATP